MQTPVPRRADARVRADDRRARAARAGDLERPGDRARPDALSSRWRSSCASCSVPARRGGRPAARRDRRARSARVRSLPRMLAMAVIRARPRAAQPLGPLPGGGRAVRRAAVRAAGAPARRAGRDDSMLALLLEQRDEHGNPPTRPAPARPARRAAGRRPRQLGGIARVGVRASRAPPSGQARLREGDPALPRRGRQGGPAGPPGADDRAAPAARAGADRRAERCPAGVQVAACLWLALRREDLWPQAARVPPRAMARLPAGQIPVSWIPFGGGVRRCAGAPFAEMEMREVLRAAAGLTIRPRRSQRRARAAQHARRRAGPRRRDAGRLNGPTRPSLRVVLTVSPEGAAPQSR